MKEIILKCPDEFTDEQIEFIKRSALNQIEAELKNKLKVPQADIDACEAKIIEVKEAMGIVDEVVKEQKPEPIEDIKPEPAKEPIEEPIEDIKIV